MRTTTVASSEARFNAVNLPYRFAALSWSAVDQPLRIDFAAGTRLYRETDRPSQFPIHRNGPPGTFVVFPDGLRVSLPTDQIVAADDSDGRASVSFGGMAFAGMIEGRLTFQRVREMWPEAQLSPDRSHTMYLEPEWVVAVWVEGREAWSALPGTT